MRSENSRSMRSNSEVNNPGQDDPTFVKMCRQGLSSMHQGILDLGTTVGSMCQADRPIESDVRLQGDCSQCSVNVKSLLLH